MSVLITDELYESLRSHLDYNSQYELIFELEESVRPAENIKVEYCVQYLNYDLDNGSPNTIERSFTSLESAQAMLDEMLEIRKIEDGQERYRRYKKFSETDKSFGGLVQDYIVKRTTIEEFA